MKTTLVELEHVQAIGISLSHFVEEVLKTVRKVAGRVLSRHTSLAIEMGKLPEETSASCSFDSTIEVESLKVPLHFTHGLDSLSCDAPPLNGLQAQARLILAPVTNPAPLANRPDLL